MRSSASSRRSATGPRSSRSSLADTLRQGRIHRVRVPVAAAAAQHIRLASLPAGVTVAPGRIEVTFTGPREAVQQLYALAQALLNDFDAFEKAV